MYLNVMSTVVFLIIFNNVLCFNESCNDVTTATITNKRYRRHLTFRKASKFFFRFNLKDAVLPETGIFSYGYGFRINFDMPEEGKLHKISRRNIHDTLREAIEQHGFDGESCIQKFICDADKLKFDTNVILKMFKMIFKSDEEVFKPEENSCKKIEISCPLALLELSQYTDL